jgi:cytochrome c oxidase subunit II
MTLAAISDYLDLNKLMGMLPNHSDHGKEIDHMLNVCHWFMLALFVGWGTFFLYTIYRFHRSRNPKANYHGVRSHASTHLEASVVIIEAVILLGFGIPLWGKRVNEIPTEQDNPIRIRAIGFQFGWNYHYAGKDGKYASQNVRFITGTNPLGLDPNDPNGADDAIILDNNMQLELGRATVVRVSSRDVIHGFALHEMRVQQDAIPGTEAPIWFRPVTIGEWQVICAQLCGAGHSLMRGSYTVLSTEDWNKWMADRVKSTQETLDNQRKKIAETAAATAKPAGEHH